MGEIIITVPDYFSALKYHGLVDSVENFSVDKSSMYRCIDVLTSGEIKITLYKSLNTLFRHAFLSY